MFRLIKVAEDQMLAQSTLPFRMSFPVCPTAHVMRTAGGANPGAVLMESNIEVEGDIEVAMRLVEMFGGPSPY
jgi:hypothetical protein